MVPRGAIEISRGSMNLRMQPPGQDSNFATPWKGGGIGQAKEDCFLPRRLWGAVTYDLHRTWGYTRNLACPRLPSLAPPELKHLSSFSISIRSTATSEESSTRIAPHLKRMAANHSSRRSVSLESPDTFRVECPHETLDPSVDRLLLCPGHPRTTRLKLVSGRAFPACDGVARGWHLPIGRCAFG